jgi:hypothetical protein
VKQEPRPARAENPRPSGRGEVNELIPSPNKPRPSGLTLEVADLLRRIEINYGREGSGPGTRFEGRLLEDVQAEAVLRRVAEFADKAGAHCFHCDECREPVSFADLLTGDFGG